jgi:hypothetical protein
VLEAIREQKTSAELASLYQVHPGQIRNWKGIVLKGLVDLFSDRQKGGLNRGKVRDAIENIKNFVVITGIYNLSPEDHCGITTKDLTMIKAEKGRFKIAE